MPICAAGGMATLVAALSKDRASAMSVVMFFCSSLNTVYMIPEQLNTAMTLLGRMQGVMHVSRVLCPEVGNDEDASTALGMYCQLSLRRCLISLAL